MPKRPHSSAIARSCASPPPCSCSRRRSGQHAQAGHRGDVDDAPAGEGARCRAPRRAPACACPPPARRRRRPCVLVSKIEVVRSSVHVGERCVVLTPELLTRMSIVPISVSAWATAALMLSRGRSRQARPRGRRRRRPRSRRAAPSGRSTRRPASTTAAPAAPGCGELCAQAAGRPVTRPRGRKGRC